MLGFVVIAATTLRVTKLCLSKFVPTSASVMNLWNSIAAVLWTAWEYLLNPVLYTIAPLIFSVAIGYFLIRIRAKREAEIRRLTIQVGDLRQRLDFIHATTVAVAIELNGAGSFQLPLLTQITWISPRRDDRLIAGFRSEDGKRIFAEISYLAVAQLLNDHRAMPLDKGIFSTTTCSFDLAQPADAYELPVLPRFEGHLQRGRDLRILVFSSEEGRKILFPVSAETYKKLLQEFKAALVSHQQEKRRR
jgi:hypothetical protein